MRRSDLVQHKEKEKATTTRTSQIVFGERQHLLRVLDSLEGTDLPLARAQQERRSLEELIHARTRELNQINGQIFVFFVLVVAAAEAAVGLALVIAMFRNRESLNVDQSNLLKW